MFLQCLLESKSTESLVSIRACTLWAKPKLSEHAEHCAQTPKRMEKKGMRKKVKKKKKKTWKGTNTLFLFNSSLPQTKQKKKYIYRTNDQTNEWMKERRVNWAHSHTQKQMKTILLWVSIFFKDEPSLFGLGHTKNREKMKTHFVLLFTFVQMLCM